MYAVIDEKKQELTKLCRNYRVRRLALFGSATGKDFAPSRSDLDFLVEFRDLASGEYADTYFGLLEGLEALFDRPVDLVMASAVDNPYLIQEIQQSEIELYAA